MKTIIKKLVIEELVIKKLIVEPINPIEQNMNVIHVIGQNLSSALQSPEAFKQYLEQESNMTKVEVNLVQTGEGKFAISFTATGESLNLENLGIESITGNLNNIIGLKYLNLANNQITKLNDLQLPTTVCFISLDGSPFTSQSYDDSIGFANSLHNATNNDLYEIRILNIEVSANDTLFRDILINKGWVLTQYISR